MSQAETTTGAREEVISIIAQMRQQPSALKTVARIQSWVTIGWGTWVLVGTLLGLSDSLQAGVVSSPWLGLTASILGVVGLACARLSDRRAWVASGAATALVWSYVLVLTFTSWDLGPDTPLHVTAALGSLWVAKG